MKNPTFIPILLFFLFIQCSPTLIQRPIPFDDERKQLSLEYMNERYGLDRSLPWIEPKMVVVHWTAIPDLERSFLAFTESRIPESREKVAGASALNVSAHYLVDRDGTIFQLMPNTLFARHVIGLNHSAIGIENVGNQEMGLSKEQIKANIKLIKDLRKKFEIDYVIGHHEYQAFIDHELWLEKDPNYLTQKRDPGDEYMLKIRKKLKGLKPIKP